MKVFGFLYESVIEDCQQEAGCASASTELYNTKDEARAAMLQSVNNEISDWNAEENEDIDAITHCDDLIWVEELNGYWSLFEAELKL